MKQTNQLLGDPPFWETPIDLPKARADRRSPQELQLRAALWVFHSCDQGLQGAHLRGDIWGSTLGVCSDCLGSNFANASV